MEVGVRRVGSREVKGDRVVPPKISVFRKQLMHIHFIWGKLRAVYMSPGKWEGFFLG